MARKQRKKECRLHVTVWACFQDLLWQLPCLLQASTWSEASASQVSIDDYSWRVPETTHILLSTKMILQAPEDGLFLFYSELQILTFTAMVGPTRT